MTGPGTGDLAARVQALLLDRGQTLAVAESLTGGLIGAALTAVPGASAVFQGGVIAYATKSKADVLGVSAALLAEHGAVHPDVAAAMARGARRVLSATFGLAVTGVAGPEPQDGRPVGTVFLACTGPDQRSRVLRLHLEGDRETIRERTVEQALTLLLDRLDDTSGK